MPVLVGANDLRKSFGARTLFSGLHFVVDEGERIGLIGPNGAGKSTLLKILAGLEDADSGTLTRQKGTRVGYLSQTPVLDETATVEQVIAAAVPKSQHDEKDALTGLWLSRLDLTELQDSRVGTLSGGWKKRVALAAELVLGPDLLLLDEPTNHLDVESIFWLEEFVMNARFATVTITHDRAFLQRVSSRIIELDPRNPGGLLSVDGNYRDYLQRKEELLDTMNQQEASLKNTLRRETEWLRRGPKARTTKQTARINAAGELQAQVDELSSRNQSRTAGLNFEATRKNPKRLVEGKAVTKRMNGRPLFSDVEIFLGPGDRIGLLGTNGCGKSTLIRVLLGEDQPDGGTVYRSDKLKVAYFQQNRESLDPSMTLKNTLCPHGDHVNYRGNLVHIHGYLDRFLFKKEQRDLVVGKLSGGEQSRLLIARLMLQETNFLVLDEPTNDLDLQTLDVLQDCLNDFEGAVLFVTHDRVFIDQVATQILGFFPSPGGGSDVITFAELSQWQDWRARRNAQAKVAAKKENAADNVPKKRKLGFNETRELAGMEANIHKTEEKLKLLQVEVEKPENQSNGSKLAELCAEIATAESQIEKLYARWAELEAMK